MQSKTGFLILILTFYGLIFVLYGFVFNIPHNVDGTCPSGINCESETLTGTSFSFGGIITGISGSPWWVNTILFAPLVISLAFIIVTSLPTFNGGA
jgi:hypothetical protein